MLSKTYKGIDGGIYTLVNYMVDFKEFIEEAKKQKYICFDTETNGLNWVIHNPCGISIGWGVQNNYYIPVDHKGDAKNLNIEDIIDDLKELFSNKDKIFIGHHTKFDMHMLMNLGIEVKGIIHDTLNMSKILNENEKHGLKDLACKYINFKADSLEKDVAKFRADEAKRWRREFQRLLVEETNKIVTRKTSSRLFISAQELETIRLNALEEAKDNLKKHTYAKNGVDDVTYDYVPLDIMAPYACADVHYTYLLYKMFVFHITNSADYKKVYLNEVRLNNELFYTERFGVKIDRPYLEQVGVELEAQLEQSRKDIYKAFGKEFNIDSNQQLVEVLLEKGVKLTKLSKTSKERLERGGKGEVAFAIDKEVLEALAEENEYASMILEHRKATKKKGTYVDGILGLLDGNDYVHTKFNASVTSGRMSSSDPNAQNIEARDKTIRRAFIKPSDDYRLIYIDESQVELRIAAHYSQDPVLMSCYPFEGEPKDVHLITAAEIVMGVGVNELRSWKGDKSNHVVGTPNCNCKSCLFDFARLAAKRVNFGILYGVGPYGLSKQIPGNKSEDQCKAYIDGYLRHYKGVNQFIKDTKQKLKKDEYVVTEFGRYRRFPGFRAMPFAQQARCERQAVNYIIQSHAADMFKTAVVNIGKYLRDNNLRTRMTNFIHDEIQFYFHKDEMKKHLQEVKFIMEDFELSVPLVAEISISDTNWADKKEYKIPMYSEIIGIYQL
jgi:DNA polymerase-1